MTSPDLHRHLTPKSSVIFLTLITYLSQFCHPNDTTFSLLRLEAFVPVFLVKMRCSTFKAPLAFGSCFYLFVFQINKIKIVKEGRERETKKRRDSAPPLMKIFLCVISIQNLGSGSWKCVLSLPPRLGTGGGGCFSLLSTCKIRYLCPGILYLIYISFVIPIISRLPL